MKVGIFNTVDKSIQVFNTLNKAANHLGVTKFILSKQFKDADHFYHKQLFITKNVTVINLKGNKI